LVAALPEPHFYGKVSTSLGFYSAAHKLCLQSSQHYWASYETHTLNSDTCYFIYARREPNNFLALTVKVSPNFPITDFSTDSIHVLLKLKDYFWWSAERQGRAQALFHLCSPLWLFSAQQSKGRSWSWSWI